MSEQSGFSLIEYWVDGNVERVGERGGEERRPNRQAEGNGRRSSKSDSLSE